MPVLPVGPVDLDDPHATGRQVAGQPGAVAAGPLDPDQRDVPELREPAQQAAYPAAVAGNSRVPSSPPRESSAAATCTSEWVSTPPVIMVLSLRWSLPSLSYFRDGTHLLAADP